jgi:uncharacterized protein YndB with AHSA1/START domain
MRSRTRSFLATAGSDNFYPMKPKIFIDKKIDIRVPASRVWEVLTDRKYTDVWAKEFSSGGPTFHIESEWKLGSPVTWRSEDGTVIVDGEVTAIVPKELLRFTVTDVRSTEKFLIGEEDGITFILSNPNDHTILRALQGDFSVMKEGEKYCELSTQVWDRVLPLIKQLSEI